MSYLGNKRDEVETIYNELKNHNRLYDDVDTICEPYCGSSAMSYYISTLHPNKYKYILNDNNQHLIELYNILSNDNLLKDFIIKINKLCFQDNKFINKEHYNNIVKINNIEGYFIGLYYKGLRPALYPVRKTTPLDYQTIFKKPIMKFLRTENITFSCMDSIDIIKNNNKNNVLILCDPPYLLANNDFYLNSNVNIYDWLYNNHHILINCCFILEYSWIIKLLFKDIPKAIYSKKYTGPRKRMTEHVIAFYHS
jgi:site-specific DNA-adenine methylase